MNQEEATRRFYAYVWPLRAMVLRTARFLGNDSAQADDLAQETLLKAYRAIAGFDVTTSASAWLTAILRNTHIDHRRASARRAGDVSLDVVEAVISDSPAENSSPDPHDIDALLEEFSDERLIAVLQRLPLEIRWTLLLVDVEQMGYDEAATILEVPSGTVKSRVHRGRHMLKELLLTKADKADIGG
jgi:RNA polymerase sigma-70 factor (ECF subfamily)